MSERVPPSFRIGRRNLTQPEPSAPEPSRNKKQKRADRFADKLPEWKRERLEERRQHEQVVADKVEQIDRLQARLRYYEAAPFEMRRLYDMACEAAR